MNAGDWQAAAEVFGVILVVANIAFNALLYRMAAKFVTRKEHTDQHLLMQNKLVEVEGNVEDIQKKMGGLVTNDQAAEIYRRIGTVENQGSRMIGQLGGMETQLGGINNMLQLLVKNELDGGRKS
jgi:hypothetical protein